MYPPFFFRQRKRDDEKYFPGAWRVLVESDIYDYSSAVSKTDVSIIFFNKCDLLGKDQ